LIEGLRHVSTEATSSSPDEGGIGFAYWFLVQKRSSTSKAGGRIGVGVPGDAGPD